MFPNKESVTLGMEQNQGPTDQKDQIFESLGGESGQGTDPSKAVTLGEVQKLIQDNFALIEKNLSEQNRRRIQSSSASAESRIQRQVKAGLENLNATVEKLKAEGVQVTPASIQNLKNKIIEQAYLDDGQNKQGAAGQHQQQPQANGQESFGQQGQQQLVEQIATSVYAEVGMTVDQNDPEASMVDWSTPVKFMQTLTKAAEKKKARINTDPSLRTANGGGQSGGSGSDTLLAQYQKEVAAIPRGSTYAASLVNLNIKYRNKGLNV